jgi:hypothetical protein
VSDEQATLIVAHATITTIKLIVARRERALAFFKDDIVPEECQEDLDLPTGRYRIIITNTIQSRLTIRFISGGASFRMTSLFLFLT